MCWFVSFMYGLYYLSVAKFFEPCKYDLAWKVFKSIKFTDLDEDEWHSADERSETPEA